ncbi:hypothetical protein BCR43DRAFT_561516 [Syncephalastrum racemosum]|uniref:SH3 domain-containing protein n=1 Tax=Syncephalastrum racemosum TaxID=13706 RepID=A0A1X2HPA6_SYNRA|nr:hypothetical protein BCR43DRAFT_561516 [Syncephalastrum racemosum]
MNLNLSHVTASPLILASACLAATGWLILFIAGCVAGLHGASWWVIIYQLMYVVGLYCVLAKHTFAHYHYSLLVLLAISIAMLTQLSEVLLNRGDGASRTAAGGAVIMIIMQYLWVFLFGSSEDSWFHQSLYGLSTPTSAGTASSIGQQQHSAKEMSTRSLAAPSVEELVSQPPSPYKPDDDSVLAMRDEARAAHSYRANPEDPNELSFDKNEILEILDRRGNWWQARKMDGSIGIVPSNYFPA